MRFLKLGGVGLALAALQLAGPAAATEAAGPRSEPAPRVERVVLVSVDGLRPEFYLDERWPAPMMQQMRAEGAHAEAVRGVFPTVTYPSHTTMVTGALPARHGVYYNSPFEPGGQTGRWYWEAEHIRVPTLWQAVRAAGGTSAALGWPVSQGAEIDFNLPEVWSLDPDAVPLAAQRAATRPRGLWEELERNAAGPLNGDTFHIAHMTREDRAGDVAAYLLERHRPTLLAIHLIETDHFQHEHGREHPMVRRAVAAVDRALAQVVEAAERSGLLESTVFVVTGDHGFIDMHSDLAPNVWLVEEGLMEAQPDRGDWRATFHVSSSSAFLHLRDPGDAAALARVRDLLEGLPPALRRSFEVLDRQALAELGAAPEAALALSPAPGFHFTADAAPPAVRPFTGGSHGLHPRWPQIHTGFVAWGAGIRPGVAVPLLHLTDVAPLIAELLGLDFEAPDGQVPWGLLTATGSGETP